MKHTGLVYVFTGNGKGKTSAALGTALRAVGHGKRVAIIQWYKERKWNIGEHKLGELFQVFPMGKGFYALPTDHASKAEHRRAAREALKLAEKLLIQKVASKGESFRGQLFIIVLDEVLNAIHDKLITLSDIVDLISRRGETHLILTGRNCPKEFVELADLVTEMKNIKHPYQQGKKAVMGLDY